MTRRRRKRKPRRVQSTVVKAERGSRRSSRQRLRVEWAETPARTPLWRRQRDAESELQAAGHEAPKTRRVRRHPSERCGGVPRGGTPPRPSGSTRARARCGPARSKTGGRRPRVEGRAASRTQPPPRPPHRRLRLPRVSTTECHGPPTPATTFSATRALRRPRKRGRRLCARSRRRPQTRQRRRTVRWDESMECHGAEPMASNGLSTARFERDGPPSWLARMRWRPAMAPLAPLHCPHPRRLRTAARRWRRCGVHAATAT